VAQEHAVGVAVATFDSLTDAVKDEVRKDAEERCVSYVFLRQSGPQHAKLKMDLQKDFTTGENKHPKTCQATLHLLDKHTKTALTKPSSSEGASFAQGGGGGGGAKGKKKKEACDKACWKDMTCHACQEKGHPANHCPNDDKKADKDDDAASAANSVSKLKKDFKKMSKAFTTVNAKLEQLKESESDLSGSEGEEASHFQHFNLLSLSPNSGRTFLMCSSKLTATRSPWTSGTLHCWTVSPQWISFVTRTLFRRFIARPSTP
jgi:hypothetical protein